MSSIFSSTKQQKMVKTISACTVQKVPIYLYKPLKNIFSRKKIPLKIRKLLVALTQLNHVASPDGVNFPYVQ